MPVLKTKYGETQVALTDELKLVVPSEFSKPCIMKKRGTNGSVKVQYWNLVTDRKASKRLPSIEEAETFRDSVSWTRDQVLKTVTVADVLANPYYFQKYHRLAPQAIEFEAQEVPLDPMFVGIWLGDGCSRRCQITTADKEILDYITRVADSYGMQVVQQKYEIDYTITNGNHGRAGRVQTIGKDAMMQAIEFEGSLKEAADKFGITVSTLTRYKTMYANGTLEEYYRLHAQNPITLILKELGLILNKHIPKCYLENSRDVRLKVLAGLIDTDGYLHPSGGYEMCFANKRLLDDVVTLARSLGFKCKEVESVMKTCTNAVGGPKACQAYRSYISGGNDLKDIPVLLERKRIVKDRVQRYDQEHFQIIPDPAVAEA